MGAPTVSVRCPACGAELTVVLAPSPPTQWFPCPRCHAPVPVVVPRDPPPLYTWEVFPELYPPLPPPRRPRMSLRRLAQVSLLAVAVLAVVLGAFLGLVGAEATGPGSYVVSGVVYQNETGGASAPFAGATVVLTTDSGQEIVSHTNHAGEFSFSGVPVGGISLNFSATGYAPVTVATFASPVYNAGTTGITVTLVPGGVGNGTTEYLSPFSDLESFLASVGSGVALLGIVAAIGAIAARVTRRSDRPAVGVVGGIAAFLAPVALYLLALGGIFPTLTAGIAALASVGVFAATVRAIDISQVGAERHD